MAKTPSEKQSRKRLIDWARQYGCEADLMKIFNKYDDLLKGCKTEAERKAIAAAGIIEIDNFFGGRSESLYADGVRIK